MYIFGESWDCYAALADMSAGYWDAVTAGGLTLQAGRFAGSQALQITSAASTNLTKSSAVNDAVHHLSVAYRQTAVLSGTTLGLYFQLIDNVTNQVCIVFRTDGTILLTSATPAGTVLATYAGAVTAQNTWFQFEFEVVINNTTGSFTVRKNGSPTNDFAATSLNTRPGANSYANKLFIAESSTVNGVQVDDLLWRSDAASVPWAGDIRCITRMPASDASVTFARSPNPATDIVAVSTTASDPTGTSRYTRFTPAFTGTVGSVAINVNTGFTGNMKCSIFADNGATAPGVVLGSATPLVNPVTGANVFTFGTPVAVTKGVLYWSAVSHDVTAILSVGVGTGGKTSTAVPYASFPAASPTVGANTAPAAHTVNITPTTSAEFVNEALQDGTTSYVYDATPGNADLYAIGTIASTPAATVAVTTRAFMAKSDAGTRTAAVQLKSGGTTVAAPTLTLTTGWLWSWRTDTTNPATGAAWTSTAVNAAQAGPKVIA